MEHTPIRCQEDWEKFYARIKNKTGADYPYPKLWSAMSEPEQRKAVAMLYWEEYQFSQASPTYIGLKPYKEKAGKLRFDLIPPEFDLAFAEVATFGIQKLHQLGVHGPDRNWEKGLLLVADHLAAIKRHINQWERGIDLDEESHFNHLQHALWHLGAMVTMVKRGRTDLDDRNKLC